MKYTFGSPKMHDLNHIIVENLITIKFNYQNHAINQILEHLVRGEFIFF